MTFDPLKEKGVKADVAAEHLNLGHDVVDVFG